jgi:hypothetical protein
MKRKGGVDDDGPPPSKKAAIDLTNDDGNAAAVPIDLSHDDDGDAEILHLSQAASYKMSENMLSESRRSSRVPNSAKQTVDKTRELYVAVFAKQHECKKVNPHYWRQTFQDMATRAHDSVLLASSQDGDRKGSSGSTMSMECEPLAEAWRSTPPLKQSTSPPPPFRWMLSSSSVAMEVDKSSGSCSSLRSVVLVGRYPGCDIELPELSGPHTQMSRLHAMIFAMPSIGKTFVVDVGSLLGIETVRREHKDQPLVSSRVGDRHMIMLDYGESALLRLAREPDDFYLTLHPTTTPPATATNAST